MTSLEFVKAALDASGALSAGGSLDAWGATQAERGEKIAMMRDYATGDHPQNLSESMRRMLRVPSSAAGSEFCLNYMDIVIQTLADRLRVADVDANAPEAATWAAERLAHSRFDALQHDVHEAAICDGDTYVMVYYDAATGTARLCHEPAWDGENGMLIFYESAAVEPSAAVKVWKTGEITRVNVYLPDRVARYVSENGTLTPYETDEQAAVSAWTLQDGTPIGIPIIHFRNRARRYQPYGMSEIETAIPIQNALNRTLYSMVMAAEMTAFQIRYAVGWQPPAELSPGMWLTISGERPLENDENVQIGALSQGELAPYLDMARYLAGEIGKITRTPMITDEAFGKTFGNASGESLKQREVGLVGKAKRFQVKAGEAWSQCLALMARIEAAFGGGSAGDAVRFRVHWADVDVRSDGEVIDNALKVADHVGKREFLRLIAPVYGYDALKIEAILGEVD